jgi:hypothetical protein
MKYGIANPFADEDPPEVDEALVAAVAALEGK